MSLAHLPLLRAALCCVLLCPTCLQSQPPLGVKANPPIESIDLDMYTRIRDEGFLHSHVMEFAEALMDGIGPRLTGSPKMAKANSWTRDTLTKIGLENAHLEDWGEFGMGWQQTNAWARIVSPDQEPLWLQAAPWSAATNGPVTGEAVYLDPATLTPNDLMKLKGTLSGKIVLLGGMRSTPDIKDPLSHIYSTADLAALKEFGDTDMPHLNGIHLAGLIPLLKSEGVAAILQPSRDAESGGGTGMILDDNGLDLSRSPQVKATAFPVPHAVMMIEHYNRLARLLTQHVPVTIEVNIATQVTGEHEHGFNTIAEIPGVDPMLKDQVVLVGGHLDSWIGGTGATDNGAGVVIAMEAMRILKTLGVQPRRTIRIALWSGEEEGVYGSRGYVQRHLGEFAEPATPQDTRLPDFLRERGKLTTKPEWNLFDAYFNLDYGTGAIRGIYAEDNLAAASIFHQWIAPLADLGVTTVTARSNGGSDHESFNAAGLPGFNFMQDPLDYETRTHHSNLDTVDHLNPADLRQAAVVEAIFLYNTSERETMLPRKPFPHPELEKLKNLPLVGLYPNAQTNPSRP